MARGSKGEQLKKMQRAAQQFNTGKHRSDETKIKISEARHRLKLLSGAPESPYFCLPMFISQNRWYIAKDSKKFPHARLVYEKFHGTIPKNFVIHHLDGDSFNDDPVNLIALSRADHIDLHNYWRIIEHWMNTKILGVDIYQKWQIYRGLRCVE